jgi:hypothetical protein
MTFFVIVVDSLYCTEVMKRKPIELTPSAFPTMWQRGLVFFFTVSVSAYAELNMYPGGDKYTVYSRI